MRGAGPATVSVAEDRLSKESCLGLPELDSTSIDLAKYPALHFGKVAIAVCQLQYFFLFWTRRQRGGIFKHRGCELLALFDSQMR